MAGGTDAVYELEGAAELADGREPGFVDDGTTELVGGTTYPLEETTKLGTADETGIEALVASVAVLSEGTTTTLLEPVGMAPDDTVIMTGTDGVAEDVTITRLELNEEAPYSLEAGALEGAVATGPEELGTVGTVIDGVSYSFEEGTTVDRALV
ncbi:hypothetical protein PtrM4_068750 [Pyrenophora tritici-repentis]|uniref:Uncharacterized protein n=1 Tax=Pyrenophora tritici-repentis TaxID=45151 RepID=A0A834S4D2_9PLEO|nr:hypothetical protein PtrM4_068750 [Pyrenophora tritici-repentis]